MVTASKATLSGINNVQTGFTLGISDSLANLLNDNGTAINDNVTAAAGDDADIKITITDDSTSITATKLSLITAATKEQSHYLILIQSQEWSRIKGVRNRCGDSGSGNNCDSKCGDSISSQQRRSN